MSTCIYNYTLVLFMSCKHIVYMLYNYIYYNKIYREKSILMVAWCPAFSNLG